MMVKLETSEFVPVRYRAQMPIKIAFEPQGFKEQIVHKCWLVIGL